MKKNLLLPAFLSLALFSGPASFAKNNSPEKTDEATTKSENSGASRKTPVGPKLNAAAVRSVVKANMLAVQKCYTDLLIEGMATTGKVVVTWDIDAEGKAQNIATKNLKPEAQALSGCVTEKISSWPFPAAQADKTFPVSYTFNFGS